MMVEMELRKRKGVVFSPCPGSRPLLATLVMVLERFSLFPPGRRAHDLHGRHEKQQQTNAVNVKTTQNKLVQVYESGKPTRKEKTGESRTDKNTVTTRRKWKINKGNSLTQTKPPEGILLEWMVGGDG